MNLKNISAILNATNFGEITKRNLILKEIAKNPNAITDVLRLLDIERHEKDELITDLNLLLSKAHTGLETPILNGNGFMQKEIRKFYEHGRIGHCFMDITKQDQNNTDLENK